MTTKLKSYFPMLKKRETLLAEIESKQKLKQLYSEWTEEQQEEFLDFCTGVRGIKFLYDSFFKEIMNPETASERLEEFHEFQNEYIHHANPKFNIGLKLNLLQDYVMIPLDIYKQIYHNTIKSKISVHSLSITSWKHGLHCFLWMTRK